MRHLVLQYLSCKDKDVRVHMEDALMALFRASESEKLAILNRRRVEDLSNESYVSSISGMFGISAAVNGMLPLNSGHGASGSSSSLGQSR